MDLHLPSFQTIQQEQIAANFLATAIVLGVILPRTTSRRWRNLIRRAGRTAALIVPDLLLVALLVVRWRSTLAPLPFAVDDRSDVQEAHDSSAHRVRNDRATSRASQLQTQTTVDHAKDDCDTTDADVGERHSRTTAVLLERAVVQPAAEGLADEEDEQDDADDRVSLGEVVAVDGDPDADAEGSDVDEESEDLQSGVHPDEAGEAGNADEDAANGEEGDESERGHDAVCEEQSLGRDARGAVAAVLGELVA